LHPIVRFLKLPMLGSILALSACAGGSIESGDKATTFAPVTLVALGDMPYRPGDIPAFEALLDTINATPHDVTIHVGDIKSGGSPCTDALFHRQRDYLDSVAGPLIYIPGDNEWTDCHRTSAGGYDPLERLALLREVFFVEGMSLGQNPLAVVQQSTHFETKSGLIENMRWDPNGVAFITAHVVGSNNGLNPKDPSAVAEYEARNAANVAWIEDGFARAKRERAAVVVLGIHGDPFLTYGVGGGFRDTLAAISQGALEFGGPVLVIHGDGHEYTVDTPFQGPDGGVLANVFRVEVPGAADILAVRVKIDLSARTVFAFELIAPN